MDEFRRICWSSPAKLFINIAPTPQLQNRILQSLALNPDYAAEEDMEPSSPEVDGMTLQERDSVLREIYNLSTKAQIPKWNADRFHSLLLKVGWEYKEAAWSGKWWKWEQVYTPPYHNRSGKF